MKVLVVGGSEEYAGAPYLAGIAALRAGAESVIVVAPQRVAWAINALSPDLMTRKMKGAYLSLTHEPAIQKLLKTADVLVIGNGIGTRPATAKLVNALIRSDIRKVIDADALKVLRTNVTNAILTPNEGEWKLLEKHGNIAKLLTNNVIVHKGTRTQIRFGKKKISLGRVNPGLSKAGMGDVLAGLCTGFLATGLSRFESAKRACKVGQEAAEILTKKKRGYHFLASDLVAEIAKARRAR